MKDSPHLKDDILPEACQSLQRTFQRGSLRAMFGLQFLCKYMGNKMKDKRRNRKNISSRLSWHLGIDSIHCS